MTSLVGTPVVFGMPPEIKPISGATGRIRLRFRPKDFARCYVKTEHGIEQHVIEIRKDGSWRLGFKLGQNERREAA